MTYSRGDLYSSDECSLRYASTTLDVPEQADKLVKRRGATPSLSEKSSLSPSLDLLYDLHLRRVDLHYQRTEGYGSVD